MVPQASWSASGNSPLSAYSQSFLLSAGLKHDQRKVNIPLKQHTPSGYNQASINYIDIKINSIVDFWIFYLQVCLLGAKVECKVELVVSYLSSFPLVYGAQDRASGAS